jgi:hypothetical protein
VRVVSARRTPNSTARAQCRCVRRAPEPLLRQRRRPPYHLRAPASPPRSVADTIARRMPTAGNLARRRRPMRRPWRVTRRRPKRVGMTRHAPVVSSRLGAGTAA